ncbi:hypothetical protein NL676_036924 [Syzygium grande]|nr:hypothetical protein NL676_036924 [Syzygium grande]
MRRWCIAGRKILVVGTKIFSTVDRDAARRYRRQSGRRQARYRSRAADGKCGTAGGNVAVHVAYHPSSMKENSLSMSSWVYRFQWQTARQETNHPSVLLPAGHPSVTTVPKSPDSVRSMAAPVV